MAEKHGSSKETDITSLLVVVFILMVGILIAKVAGDFAQRSTSISSRASSRRTATMPDFDAFCQNKFTNTYKMSEYVKYTKNVHAKLLCDSGEHTVFAGLLTKPGGGSPGTCCVNLGQLFTANDAFCTSIDSGVESRCKLNDSKSCSKVYGTDTLNKFTKQAKGNHYCDYLDAGKRKEGKNTCCIKP